MYQMGKHYGIPGFMVGGQDVADVAKGNKAVVDVMSGKGPAIPRRS